MCAGGTERRAMVAHTRAVQRGHGHRAVRRFRRCRGRGRLRRHLAARAVPPARHAARWPHRSRHAPAVGGPRPRRHRHRGGGRLARTSPRGPAPVPAPRLPDGDLPRRRRSSSVPARWSPCTSARRRRSTWPPSASQRCATPPPTGVCRSHSSSRPSPPSPTSRRHGPSPASRIVRTPASLVDLWHHRRGGNDDDALRSGRRQPGPLGAALRRCRRSRRAAARGRDPPLPAR